MIKILILLIGIVIYSEGKNCPELTRAHLTRCDMYYKCTVLPSGNHVWIPTTCNKGLIYEHSLRICVLPGDDWECTLGDTQLNANNDNSNIYGINNLHYLTHQIDSYRLATTPTTATTTLNNGNYIEISSDEIDAASNDEQNKIESNESYEVLSVNDTIDENYNDDDIGYSGDGAISINNDSNHNQIIDVNDSSDNSIKNNVLEDKEGYLAIPLNSNPNLSVASHLQRLTQLIDSLKKSQHNHSQSYELTANDLNSFLANHNIQTEYQNQLNQNVNKYQLSTDGNIHPNLLQSILELQNKLQATRNTLEMVTVAPTTTTTTTPLTYSFLSNDHYSDNNNNNNNDKYQPDSTKIHLENNPLKKPIDLGYSTSQIVVNRPEGSVLFTLPTSSSAQLSDDHHQSTNHYKDEPYISQETLKTVLELSKQMVASNMQQQQQQQQQQQHQYIPEQNYLQPIFRPIYYNIPIHDLPIPIINNYNKKTKNDDNRNDYDDVDDDNNYENHKYIKTHNKHRYENNQLKYHIRNNVEEKQKLPNGQSTIIHNSIPITIEGPSPNNKQINKIHSFTTQQPMVANDPIDNSQNDNNNVKFDSYGVKISTNSNNNDYYSKVNPIPEYPPLSTQLGDVSANIQQQQSYGVYGQSNSYLPSSQPYNYNYGNNQLPPSQPYNSYNNNNNNNNNDNKYIKFSPPQYYQPESLSSYNNNNQNNNNNPIINSPNYPNYYTPSPHLHDNNVNNYINYDTQYPTIRPSQYASYPNQITTSSVLSSPSSLTSYYTSNTQPQQQQQMEINGSINTNMHANKYSNNNNNNKNNEQLEEFDDNNNDDDDDDDDGDDVDDEANFDDEDMVAADRDDSNNNSVNTIGNINELNMINLLAYLKQKQQSMSMENKQLSNTQFISSSGVGVGGGKTESDMLDDTDGKRRIVNIGGQYISYEAYKNSIIPLLQNDLSSMDRDNSASIDNTFEILTCSTGIRQPNKTDCTKYFICNANNGNVLTYTCPKYTAFNGQSRLCEPKTYAECNPLAIQSQITVDHNKKIQLEAQKTLAEANRLKAEALRTEKIAALIKLETQKLLLNSDNNKHNKPLSTKLNRLTSSSGASSTIPKRTNNRRRPQKYRQTTRGRKRLIPCHEPGKLIDSLSKYNYFLCFNGPDGKLRARKMTCPNSLIFCPSTFICTLISRCK